jgi:hypothetical protein
MAVAPPVRHALVYEARALLVPVCRAIEYCTSGRELGRCLRHRAIRTNVRRADEAGQPLLDPGPRRRAAHASRSDPPPEPSPTRLDQPVGDQRHIPQGPPQAPSSASAATHTPSSRQTTRVPAGARPSTGRREPCCGVRGARGAHPAGSVVDDLVELLPVILRTISSAASFAGPTVPMRSPSPNDIASSLTSDSPVGRLAVHPSPPSHTSQVITSSSTSTPSLETSSQRSWSPFRLASSRPAMCAASTVTATSFPSSPLA